MPARSARSYQIRKWQVMFAYSALSRLSPCSRRLVRQVVEAVAGTEVGRAARRERLRDAGRRSARPAAGSRCAAAPSTPVTVVKCAYISQCQLIWLRRTFGKRKKEPSVAARDPVLDQRRPSPAAASRTSARPPRVRQRLRDLRVDRLVHRRLGRVHALDPARDVELRIGLDRALALAPGRRVAESRARRRARSSWRLAPWCPTSAAIACVVSSALLW